MKIDGVIVDTRDGYLEGLVLGSQLAWNMNLPLWYIREPKKHGLKESIGFESKYETLNRLAKKHDMKNKKQKGCDLE